MRRYFVEEVDENGGKYMCKRSVNFCFFTLAAILFALFAIPVHADQITCKVTFKNNSNEYAVFYANGIHYGVVYPLRWNTFQLNKVNYQRQPHHFEIRQDVNKNGNPVTVKEEYVDLSNRDEYTIEYP